MSYDKNKELVLKYFNEHIIKYIIKDLEVLNKIESEIEGDGGGCAIPQAISTFAALDLIGYLIHPQEIGVVNMSFSVLLKNSKYFLEFQPLISQGDFSNSFRENIRSIMAHRFSLVKYHILKSKENHLFIKSGSTGDEIFNVSVFTDYAIKAIRNIYKDICDDTFIINGYDGRQSIEKMWERIENLKIYTGSGHKPLSNLPTPIKTPQTTRPIS